MKLEVHEPEAQFYSTIHTTPQGKAAYGDEEKMPFPE